MSNPARINRAAEISNCGQYRWWLRRSWPGGDGRCICFLMLNPSTADADFDDPTIRRCIRFAAGWGYSILSVRNLFSFRATDPRELKKADDPIGGVRGNAEIERAALAQTVVCAWGADAPPARVQEVKALLRNAQLYCLGTTKNGQPRHPLYVPGKTKLIPYTFPA